MGLFRNIFQQTLCTVAMGASAVSLLLPAQAQQQVVVAQANEMGANVSVGSLSVEPDPIACESATGIECVVSDPMSIMPDWEAPEVDTSKKVLSKKRRTVVSRAERQKQNAMKRLLQDAFNAWDAPAQEALQAPNVVSLEDSLVDKELENEAPELTTQSIDWRVVGTQPDADVALGFELPRWDMPLEIVGQFERNDFSAIHTRLKNIRKEVAALQAEEAKKVAAVKQAKKKTVARRPEAPRVAASQVVVSKESALHGALAAGVAAVQMPSRAQASTPPRTPANVASVAPGAPASQTPSDPDALPASDAVKPKLASADFVSGLSEAWVSRMKQLARNEAPPAPVIEEEQSVALPSETRVGTVQKGPAVVFSSTTQVPTTSQPHLARQNTAQTGVSTQTTQAAPPAPALKTPEIFTQDRAPSLVASRDHTEAFKTAKSVQTMYSASKSDFSHLPFGTRLEGRVTVDQEVEDFLASRKASLELFLMPANRKDHADPIFLLRYPDQIFRLDAEKLTGQFQVVALAFTPELSDPIGRAVYHQTISAQNAKQNIRFHIGLSALLSGVVAQDPTRRLVPVSLSVFEGASVNHREPKPIAGARVQVAGLPEWGEFYTDSHGDVLNLPSFPVHSRVVFIVTAADRYMPTMKTVSIGGRDPGERIYLVEKSKADWIAMLLPRDASGNPIRVGNDSAVVMGRVLDNQTHLPKEGERVVIRNHDDEKLSYFGPGSAEPLTRSEGFFSFFQVQKGLRFLNRPLDNGQERAMALRTRPGFGYYLEFGKMGAHPLHGVVDDFETRKPLDSVSYRLLGDSATYSASEDGKFTLPGVEFPAGKLTIELRREGYPATWHTAPFNPMDRQWPRKYSMVSQAEVDAALFSPGRPKWQYNLGMVVGKARGSLFDMAQDSALEVELRTPSGKKVPSTKGPFPFAGSDPATGLTRDKSAFAYWNLVPGEYVVLWRRISDGEIIRIDVTEVGSRIEPGQINQDRISVVD